MSALNEEDIDSKNGGAESKEEKAQSEEEGDAPTAEMLAKDAGIAIGKQVDRSYLKYVGREDVVELLEKFREECKDVRDISEKYFDDDMYCLRFIIGKDYDVEVAAAQFRKAMIWRKEENVSEIIDEPQNHSALRFWPRGFKRGDLDNNGCPIMFERLGALDVYGMFKYTSPDEVVRCLVQHQEISDEYQIGISHKAGEWKGITFIVDLQGLSTAHLYKHGIDTFGRIVDMASTAYPEAIGRWFIIRAPRIFVAVWALVGKFFDENQRSKFQIFGTNYIEQLEELGIPRDKIPASFGGTMVDSNGDENCLEYWGSGGQVPEDYWVDEGMREFLVKTSAVVDIPYEEEGLEMEWRWHCVARDIKFQASWVDADGLETEIHSTRFLSDFNKRKTPNAKGILRLTFDNSFSWIYNKTIRLLVKVGGKRYDGWKERRALMDSEARVVQEEGKESDARLEKK